MSVSTERAQGWFSAAELAGFGEKVGLPTSDRGCAKRAARQGWPAKVVPGKGGRRGELTLYKPPAPILAAISALDGVVIADEAHSLGGYGDLRAMSTDLSIQEDRVPYGMTATPKLDAPEDEVRLEMLLALLRTMEDRLRDPISAETADRMLEVVEAWREFAACSPHLQARLEAVRVAARLYKALGLQGDPK